MTSAKDDSGGVREFSVIDWPLPTPIGGDVTPRIFWFVKLLKKKSYAEDLIRGKLYANRLSYFRKIEEDGCTGRSDKHEGITGWFQPEFIETVSTVEANGIDMFPIVDPLPAHSNWVDNLNVFCIRALYSGDLKSINSGNIGEFKKRLEIPERFLELGKYAVMIKPKSFIDRVKAAIRSKNHRGVHGLVKYYNPETFHGPLPEKRAALWKHGKYSYQEFEVGSESR